MQRAFPLFAVILAGATLLLAVSSQAASKIIEPTIERAVANSAIIRWTTKNPGGTYLHYGVVHYGTSSQNLAETAKSPNKRGRSEGDMTFRVLLQGLGPGTTYYYWVESTGADGVSDGVRSRVSHFTTPDRP